MNESVIAKVTICKDFSVKFLRELVGIIKRFCSEGHYRLTLTKIPKKDPRGLQKYYFAHVVYAFAAYHERHSFERMDIETAHKHLVSLSPKYHKQLAHKFNFKQEVEQDNQGNIVITRTTVSTAGLDAQQWTNYINACSHHINTLYNKDVLEYKPVVVED